MIGFTILGRVQARRDGKLRADWAYPQVKKIVGALLTQPGRPMPRQLLKEWAWPEDKQPANTDATFHTNAGRIRDALAEVDVEARLIAEGNAFRLAIDKSVVDYHVFRRSIELARTANRKRDYEQAFRLAQSAIDLWQPEDPLADLDTDRAHNWRRHVIENEWLPANGTLVTALMAMGEFDAALTRVDELRLNHGDILALAAHRIEALHHLARDSDASDYYIATRRALNEAGDTAAADHLKHVHDTLIYGHLTASPLRAVAPRPAESRPVSRRRLPSDAIDFLGRESLLFKLDECAASYGRFRPSVFALVGLPGVGKTALAVRWANRQLGRLLDSALHVDLRGDPGSDPIQMAEAVDELLRQLDFPIGRLADSTSRANKLADLLNSARTLVLLDNARNSEQVRPLLPLLSSCVVLITSRQNLTELTARHGVRPFTISPLPAHDAGTLLTRRIGERAAHQRDVVEQLARLCGGLPLALQLVGRHIDVHDGVQLRAFVGEFRDHSRLLEIGGTEDGSHNLRAAFTWSYDALPAKSQQLFRLLALHPGPEISLNAAAALAGWSIKSTRHCLDVLVNAHLLHAAGTLGRFRFHDLIRAYATDLADDIPSDERKRAERCLLSYYFHSSFHADRAIFPFRTPVPLLPQVEQAPELEYANDEDAANWLLDERKNLNAIIRWAPDRGHHDYAWRIPHTVYGVFRRSGFLHDVRTALEIAVASTQYVGDLESEGATRNDLGLTYLALGDHFQANQQLSIAEAIARQMNSEIGIPISIFTRAKLESVAGDIDRSIELFHQALSVARKKGYTVLQSTTLHELGNIFQGQKRYDQAIASYQQALWLRQQISDTHGEAETLTELAAIRGERGDYSAAQADVQQALGIVEYIHDIEVSSRTFSVLATICFFQDNFDKAIEYGRQAVRLAQRTRSARVEADSLHLMARSLYRIGHIEAGHEENRQAKEIYTDLGDIQRLQRVEADLAIPAPSVPTARDDSTLINEWSPRTPEEEPATTESETSSHAGHRRTTFTRRGPH
ncbi:MAG TPA: tetratricopeptide repeat protein [Pseudonocardiaceae bacterium]|nr:tetratricopeptide repeat protein [Pseudonocardiaceae bacterium]